jgi:hypothetical protein
VNEKKKISMDVFNAMSKEGQIKALCDYHECPPKQRAVHHTQYCLKQWNPHPPEQFEKWWPHFGVLQTEWATERKWAGVPTETAFNCEAVRIVYREGKADGTLWDPPPKVPDPDKGMPVQQRLARLKALIAAISKPMPQTHYDVKNPRRGDVGDDEKPIKFV